MGQDIKSCPIFYSSPGRTRTGSISAPLRSLLNACHRHAATSNARYVERLETLKNQWFPAFFVLVNLSSNLWLPVTREFWIKSVGKMPFPWYSDFPQESVDCIYTLMLLWCCVEDDCERSKLSGGQRKYRGRMTMERISCVETNQNCGARWPGKE